MTKGEEKIMRSDPGTTPQEVSGVRERRPRRKRERSWLADLLEPAPQRASRLRREKTCKTPGVVYSIGLESPSIISIKLRFPFSVEGKVSGNSAVTEGPKLQRYEQLYAERQRFNDAIHAALEPVLAQEFFLADTTERQPEPREDQDQ